MEQWLRVTLVLVAAVAGLALSTLWSGRVKTRMVRVARDSVGRALLAVVTFFGSGVVGATVLGVVAALLDDAGRTAAMVAVCCVAMIVLSPFMVVYLSPVTPATPHLPATEQRDLEHRGARPAVARTIGVVGALLSVVPGMVCVFTFGAVALVVGPGGAAG